MTATPDDFDFYTVGTGDRPFTSYDSSSDPTTLDPTYIVRGSKNVFKDDNNNINVRVGLKRYLAQDSSLNGVKSSFEWNTSFGAERDIRVLEDGQFQVIFNGAFVTLDTFTDTRFVFTKWWDDVNQQEILVMTNGTNQILSWTGGMADGVGSINSATVLIHGGTSYALTASSNETTVLTVNDGATTIGYSAFILDSNPTNGTTGSLDMVTGSFTSGTLNFQFVTALTGSVAATAKVKIGATKEDTAANLLALLQAPSTTTIQFDGTNNANAITALGLQTFSSVNSLNSDDDETWTSKGFVAPGTLSVGGTEYTYRLIAEQYLVDISGTPATGTLAFQTIESNAGPSTTFLSDFCETITNQLILGSYSSPIIYFSADTDFLDFTNSGDLVSGDPDTIVLDELPRGVIVVNESAYIPAGNNAWYICTPNTPLPVQQTLGTNDRLVIVKVVKKVGAAKTAALAHEFLTSLADTIVYLGQDNQLRMFGIFTDLLGTKFPSVSIPVKQELLETDFTGGQIRAVGDNIFIVAPLPGLVFAYQQRDDVNSTGNIVSQRIWQPPFEWNISRIAVINGLEYGYSNQSPETYQLFNTDQWHDDSPSGPMPYDCIARFAYWQFKDRTKIGDIDKVFLEGYMFTDTDLTCTLRADYLGSTAIEDKVISAQGDSPVLFTSEGTLIGEQIIGQELLGGATSLTGIPKFRAIGVFKKHECFEYQVELHSFALDARWQIVTMGTNGSQVINNPVQLLKS
jgi:hypothetical protein